MQSQTGKVILLMGAGKPLQEQEFPLPNKLQPGAILVEMLRLGGRYLLAGSIYPNNEFTLTSQDVITKCLTITGMHNYYAKH